MAWTHITLFSQTLGQGVHPQNKHSKGHFLLEKRPPIQRQIISAKKVVVGEDSEFGLILSGKVEERIDRSCSARGANIPGLKLRKSREKIRSWT